MQKVIKMVKIKILSYIYFDTEWLLRKLKIFKLEIKSSDESG